MGPARYLKKLKPQQPTGLYDTGAILQTIEDIGERLAVVVLPGVKHSTGQVLDIEKITAAAHTVGAFAGFDLAHSIGNVPLQLHDWGVDFAAWCTYKYLNSGPGGIGAAFIHENHASDVDRFRLAGWFGNKKSTRFDTDISFCPIGDANGWQISNPPILSITALRASLEIFNEVSIQELRQQSVKLTAHLHEMLQTEFRHDIRLITPTDEAQHGCQTAFSLIDTKPGKCDLVEKMAEHNIVIDFRPPDIYRVSLAPLYNSFEDVDQLMHSLKLVLRSYK
jgi:kynureninase